jgi:hypothetical protein
MISAELLSVSVDLWSAEASDVSDETNLTSLSSVVL